MKFQALIATVDDNFPKRKYDLNINTLVVNQLLSKKESEYHLKELHSVKEKGLSKSRNRAISLSESDICLISDDDVIFVSGIDEIILKAFEEYPKADVITFQVQTPEGEPYKKYKDKPFYHNIRTLMKVSSVEIAFKREKVLETHVKFDESFGLGADFPTSEEVIFLSDLLKKKLKILYYPKVIVIHPKESSGGAFKNNRKLIEAKGAMFYRIFSYLGYLVSFIFAVRKSKYAELTVLEFYKHMLLGIKQYRLKRNKD